MNSRNNEKIPFKELVLLYHKIGFGDVARTYSDEEENKFYNLVSSKLAEKYPKFVSYKEAYDLLKDNGQIVTISTTGQRGFYDDKRNIIGIKHFLNRLTTIIFHEIVHKLSYLVGKGKIAELPEVYREAGTEYITAETLKTKTAKACVFSNIWGRFPNTISSYYLEYIFVNQLNKILGGDSLEETILRGNLSFEHRMREQFGKSKYDVLTKRMTEISKDFFHYSAFYNINSAKENRDLRARLMFSIENVQDFILRAGFDNKIRDAKTPEEAKAVLDSMLEFSDLRLRRLEEGQFVDSNFQKYFDRAKREFSLKFSNMSFEQKFTPNDWQTKYPELERVVQISPEEERKVRKMGKENYKRCKGTFFNRILGYIVGDESGVPVREMYSDEDRDFEEELRVKDVNSGNGTDKKRKKLHREEKLREVK